MQFRKEADCDFSSLSGTLITLREQVNIVLGRLLMK
jgi:hypothetical protein